MRSINDELASIMVPVYNEENYIEDCLNSIYSQTYRDIELLIANDCSTDRTLEIIREWIDKHKERFVECKVFQNKTNLGISKNFNLLLREARGKYLKSLAGDDMLMPDAIEKEVGYFKENPDADIVYANALMIGPQDRYPLDRLKTFKYFFETVPQYENGIAEALFKADVIPAPTVMLVSRTIERFGLYREDLVFEDWEYWLRLATSGGTIGYMDYPVVGYRELEISGSHYGKGREEEKRYNRIIDSEVRLLNDYKDKVKDASMDGYWNRTLKLCIDRGYKNTIKSILKSQKIRLEPVTRMMLVSYRLHLYRYMSRIWMRAKHGYNN